MVILGPLVTLSAVSSCLGTIFSGNVFACVNDLVYFVLGGIIFVAGVTTAIIGVFVPDPIPDASPSSVMRAEAGLSVASSTTFREIVAIPSRISDGLRFLG
jgi:hypothetical protein